MSDRPPEVSIVLPTHNGAKYIRQSIDSCLSQSYRDIELIIVDDCSDDDTPAIIASYRDERIKYIRHKEKQGVAAALNSGFSKARGKYLTWTSDDNFYSPVAIEVLARALESRRKVDFVYADFYKIDEKAKIICPTKVLHSDELNVSNSIGPCFLYRKSIYEQVGDYNPGLILIEDYDYWLRVRERFRMERINQTLYYYRIHKESLSAKYAREEVLRRAENLKEKYLSFHIAGYPYARKQFYKKNYAEAKRALLKCLPSQFFNPVAWRMLVMMCLGARSTTFVRMIKTAIWRENNTIEEY